MQIKVIGEKIEILKNGKETEQHECKKNWIVKFHECDLDNQSIFDRICKVCGRVERVTEFLQKEEDFNTVCKRFHGEEVQ